MRLLHIDSSPRQLRSHSRRLTQRFRVLWLARFPDTRVAYRDLRVFTPPHVSEDWIAGAFTDGAQRTPSMRQALELSDLLVDELLGADVLLLGVPMYNFGLPSVLKAYFDNVVRINRTFLFHPDDATAPYKPLLAGKQAFVVITSGDRGFAPGQPFFHLNHIEPYLRSILAFIGITDVRFLYSGNDEFGGERLQQSIAHAEENIRTLIDGMRPVAHEGMPENLGLLFRTAVGNRDGGGRFSLA